MADDILAIPIIKQSLFFLQEAGGSNGIKITETGALGRNFVQSFWEKHLKTSDDDLIFRPSKEAECPEVTKVHFLLSNSKYVIKNKGKVCLTEKGKTTLNTNKIDELYYDLFTVAIYKWNWGYEDRYPEFIFIQQAAEQLIQTLLLWPSKTMTAEKVYDAVFGRFADLIPEEDNSDLDLSDINFDLRNRLHQCFNVRFFNRFCVPFGILKDDHDHFLNKKTTDPFEKTYFFINSFSKMITSCSEKKDSKDSIKNSKLRAKPKSCFTPEAQELWDKLSKKLRLKLMNNAFCSTCKSETGIGDLSGYIEKGNLILQGNCTKCGEPVARLVENLQS